MTANSKDQRSEDDRLKKPDNDVWVPQKSQKAGQITKASVEKVGIVKERPENFDLLRKPIIKTKTIDGAGPQIKKCFQMIFFSSEFYRNSVR